MDKENTVHISYTLHVIAGHVTVYPLTAALHHTERPARPVCKQLSSKHTKEIQLERTYIQIENIESLSC